MPRIPRRAIACAIYFFLVLTSYYILKPVRDSLFLEEAGYKQLPIAHLLVVVVVVVALSGYEALTRRFSRKWMVLVTNTVFISNILIFWVVLGPMGGMKSGWQGWAWVFYAWVSVFSVFSVSLFWSFTHTLFDPVEGRKYYGYVGAGGTVGAMTGGFLTARLAEALGTVNLLLGSAVLLAPCLLIAQLLNPRPDDGPDRREEERPVARESGWQLMGKSPYLRGIAWLVLVGVCAAGLDDYRYKQVIQTVLQEFDARTAFMGNLYFSTNVLGLFIGVFLTPPLQTRFGPRPGLLLYPLCIAVGGVAMLAGAGIDLIFWVMVFQQSSAYSIFQTSRELLFTPRSAEEKFVVKGFVGTFVFRFGTGLASLFILYCWPPDGVWRISTITIPLAILLAWIGWRLSDGFEKLQAGEKEPEE